MIVSTLIAARLIRDRQIWSQRLLLKVLSGFYGAVLYCVKFFLRWPSRFHVSLSINIFSVGLSDISGGFSSRFLKCSFHFCSLSSWLVAFSFALKMLLLLFNSFTAYHIYRNCLSSTESLILLIWLWMHSSCSFWYVLDCDFWSFLSLCVLVFFNVFFSLSKDVFILLSRISLFAVDSQGTLHLAVGLDSMHSAASSLWAVTKFPYSSFGLFLSDVSLWVSNLFLTITEYWFLISLLVNDD